MSYTKKKDQLADGKKVTSYFKTGRLSRQPRPAHGRHAIANGAGSLPVSEGGTPPLEGVSQGSAGCIYKQSSKDANNNGLFVELWYDDGTDANGQFIEKQKKSSMSVKKTRVKFADPNLQEQFPPGFPAAGKGDVNVDNAVPTSGQGELPGLPAGTNPFGVKTPSKETDAGEAVNWGTQDLGGNGDSKFPNLAPELTPTTPPYGYQPPGVTPGPGGGQTPSVPNMNPELVPLDPNNTIPGVTPQFPGTNPGVPDFNPELVPQDPSEVPPIVGDPFPFDDDDSGIIIIPPIVITFDDNIQDVDPWEVSSINMATITDYWLLTGASISHDIADNVIPRPVMQEINEQHSDEELYNFDRISYRDIDNYDGSVIRPSVFYEESSGARLFYDSSADVMVGKFRAAAANVYGGGADASYADAETLRAAATGYASLEYGLFEGGLGDIANGIAIGYIQYENSVYDLDPLTMSAYINTAKLFFHTSEVPDPLFGPAEMASTFSPWDDGDSIGEYSYDHPWKYQPPERARLNSKFGYAPDYATIDVGSHVSILLEDSISTIASDLASDIFTKSDAQNVIIGNPITPNAFQKIIDMEIPEFPVDADLQELIGGPGSAVMTVQTTVTGAPTGGTFDAASVIGSGDTGATTVVTTTGASY